MDPRYSIWYSADWNKIQTSLQIEKNKFIILKRYMQRCLIVKLIKINLLKSKSSTRKLNLLMKVVLVNLSRKKGKIFNCFIHPCLFEIITSWLYFENETKSLKANWVRYLSQISLVHVSRIWTYLKIYSCIFS